MEKDREILETQIEHLNEEIRKLAYRLGGLLDVDCNLGICSYDPEADDLQAKMREVQERKALLEKIMGSLDSCSFE